MTDAPGSVVATYTYDPFGNLTAHTGSVTNPFGFAGQYTDAESGLQYLLNRYYDPSTAQFMSIDLLTSLTRSPYAYVNNDPLNWKDVSGTAPNSVDPNAVVAGDTPVAANAIPEPSPSLSELAGEAWNAIKSKVASLGENGLSVGPVTLFRGGHVDVVAGTSASVNVGHPGWSCKPCQSGR